MSFTLELTSTIPAARLFKAAVLEGHKLGPIVIPELVKSVSDIVGDGGVGSIREIIYADGTHCGSVKERVDAVDEDNFTVELTLLEAGGDEWGTCTVKVVPAPGGGSVYTVHSVFSSFWRHNELVALSNVEYNTVEIEAAKQPLVDSFRATEAYLIANPDY